MGKIIPHGYQSTRNGEQLKLADKGFTNLASLTAAGLTPANSKGCFIYCSTGGTGGVPCFTTSDGTNFKQIAIGANLI